MSEPAAPFPDLPPEVWARLEQILNRFEDAWQRGVEFLFERLVVRWDIAGTEPLTRQKELLARFRMASQTERAWIRNVLREHVAENFPELSAP